MSRLDRWVESSSRGLARGMGRRHFVSRMGRLLLGVAGVGLLPVLPVSRAAGQTMPPEPEGPEGDPKACEYWRHCAIDGFACDCCGGSASSCPPGTEMSPVTWLGTCHNPADDKDYVISYNDCCGKSFCGRCTCNRNEGERPDYHWYRANDINWCSGASSQSYHCSVAIVVSEATEPQPER